MSSRIICVALLALLTGCATKIAIPSGKQMNAEQVCGALASRKCAPSGTKAYTFQPRLTLSLDTDGTPRLGEFLGSVVSKKQAKNGRPGAYCGYVEKAFRTQEFTNTPVTSTTSVNFNFASQYSGSIQADIDDALRASGLNYAAMGAVNADVRAATKSIQDTNISATARFLEYRLDYEILRKIQAGGAGDARLTTCYQLLTANKSYIYNSLTGFHVLSLTTETYSISSALSELKSHVANVPGVTEANLAQLDVELQRISDKWTSTTFEPYFEVVGLGIWRP